MTEDQLTQAIKTLAENQNILSQQLAGIATSQELTRLSVVWNNEIQKLQREIDALELATTNLSTVAAGLQIQIDNIQTGVSGASGKSGTSGTSGTSGAQGEPGASTSGTSGTSGISGTSGTSGARGSESGSGSPYTIYASQLAGINANSSVDTGGGTDDTTVLQAALVALNAAGGGILVIDKAFLISGLHIPSSVSLVGLGWETGFYRKNAANVPAIRNANPTTTSPIDKNIQLSNFTINLNSGNQTGIDTGEQDLLLQGIAWYGIDHLAIDNIKILSQTQVTGGYAILLTNTTYTRIENTEILQATGYGHDGIHYLGPNSYITLKNITGCSGDDFIAFNANDYHNVGTCSWITNDGDINNILIDGVNLLNSGFGIDFLSSENNITNVIIRNIRGSFSDFAIAFRNIWDVPHTGGYISNVTLDNINPIKLGNSDSWPAKAIIQILTFGTGALNIRDIQISNCNWHKEIADDSYTQCPWLWVEALGAGALTIDGLSINNFLATETVENTGSLELLRINNALVRHLTVNGLAWHKPIGSTPRNYLLSGTGNITSASLSNLYIPLLLGVSNPTLAVGTMETKAAGTQTADFFQGDGSLLTNIADQFWEALDSATIKSKSDKGLSLSELFIGGSNATGGIITEVGDYTIHTFLTNGTFVPDPSHPAIDVEVIAGGGSGGSNVGGGGGGGGVETSLALPVSTPQSVVIGAGGLGVSNSGNDGEDSSFGAIVAAGGGQGSTYGSPAGSGGSGGGGSAGTLPGGSGTPGQGYDGGTGFLSGNDIGGGGGGSGSHVGDDAVSHRAGDGGDGYTSLIDGQKYSGGGGGGGYQVYGDVPGNGVDGGGNGSWTTVGSNATANTGSGGGGAAGGAGNLAGGNGGSGRVILRYLTPRKDVAITRHDGKMTISTGIEVNSLGIANSTIATSGVGSIANKFQIFDASGNSLGYIPIYSSIT